MLLLKRHNVLEGRTTLFMTEEIEFDAAMHQKTDKGRIWTPHNSQLKLWCLSCRHTILTTLFRFAG